MNMTRAVRAAIATGVWLLASGCGSSGDSPTSPSTGTSSTPTPTGAVTSAGGVVTGGSARLNVPAGAVAGSVAMSLRNVGAPSLDPYAALGTVTELVIPGSLASPATLSVSYAPSLVPWGIDPREMRLHILDGATWRAVAGSVPNPAASEVSAPVSSGGTFAVRWVPGSGVDCEGVDSRQFDFWIGVWDLRERGTSHGTNTITRNGCVVEEDFRSLGGGIGRSVSFLSALDGRWYQTYIDSAGNRLPLGGGLESDTMILHAQPGGYRATWRALSADRVRFTQESGSASSWTITFDSVYERK